MTPDLHVLIDAGFSPAQIEARLHGTGATWQSLDALVLTHTHSDHLRAKCLAICAQHDIRFICHAEHAAVLASSRYFKKLAQKELVLTYDPETPLPLSSTVTLRAIRLPHDSPPTFGFCFSVGCNGNGRNGGVSIGYLADLGYGTREIAQALADVDVLALEFNHDEHLERTSGRPRALISRVLGKEGHLSNQQAAEFFRWVLESGSNGGPRMLLQLHLSRDCNRPELAYQTAQEVLLLTGAKTRVFSTRQERRGTVHEVQQAG